jgi:hypothetical protein
MLMNLLPGLRDLRAPLSAGYLWLAAGWLYFAPQLPASVDEAQGVLKDIYRVVHASDPIAVAAGLTFLAYMLGILSTGLLSRPVVFIVKLPIYIVIFIMAIPILISEIARRPEQESINESKLTNFFAAIKIARWRYLRSGSPALRAQRLVLRRMSNKILVDEDYRSTFLARLKGDLGTIINHPSTTLGSYGLRRLRFARDLLDDTDLNEEAKTTEILKRLSKYLDEGFLEAADSLVLSVVDIERHASDILDELTLVPERLVSDRPATYERWDRLRAESEFRQAVVPPLFAIIVALVVRGVLSWPFVLLFIVPPVLILIQGIGKDREADSQLLQVLEADVISTAAIDRLMTRDLYWIRSRRHWGVLFPGEQYQPSDDS